MTLLTPRPRDGDPLYSSKESLHSFKSERYLTYSERFWRRRQPWLESNGYMLRPKFRPGWIPSWTTGATKKRTAEDAITHTNPVAIDATRMSDGLAVYVKIVNVAESGTEELDISQFFSEEPRKSDPRNHCVPVLDVLHHPEAGAGYLVIPALRPFNSPRFLTVGEAVDFFHQIFEGLLFMHENYVAHRDCGDLNVMMDASRMYPQSFHPVNINRSRDLKGRSRHLARTECRPRYYFIDFGLSEHYDPDQDEWPPMEEKVRGIDRSVPEMQDLNGLYNPFPTDVYYIGNLVRENFLKCYARLGFIEPLISRMVQEDPNRRPTMQEVVAEFQCIRGTLGKGKLSSRLAKQGEFPIAGLLREGVHLVRQIRYSIRGIRPLPDDVLSRE